MGLAAPPIRPPAITPFNTYVYKHANSNDLKVDVYLPSNPGAAPLPVALYIPGGGWMDVDRDQYSRPLFHQLLSKGFVVCCMDYRLVPETSFTEVTEDVKRIETWIRQDLPVEIGIASVKVDCNKLVAVGASAGGHLALLINAHTDVISNPKLLNCPPVAILVFYPPTDMHHLPYLNRGRLSIESCPILDCTPDLLASATDCEKPPSKFAVSQSKEDLDRPRRHFIVSTEYLLQKFCYGVW